MPAARVFLLRRMVTELLNDGSVVLCRVARMRIFFAMLVFVWPLFVAADDLCHADVPCVMEDGRSYHV
jgi:hypothetical protein